MLSTWWKVAFKSIDFVFFVNNDLIRLTNAQSVPNRLGGQI